MSYETLQPGDIAVTTTGIHMLAYLGGDDWIQADPNLGQVAILNGRADENSWFRSPVKMYRWRILENE